tara:strand:- start:173 stop:532 length:360 start_codon:yes stop_codon:yes gene_type:complete
MNQRFKLNFLFTLFLFASLILLNIFTEKNIQNSWYSLSIMFFFSFTFFQTEILENKVGKGTTFIRTQLVLTFVKMILSAGLIILYGFFNKATAEASFFIWFLILYLSYTALLSWMFYKK